ncbi:MAG: hypothetical protein ABH817_00300 [archaeon]
MKLKPSLKEKRHYLVIKGNQKEIESAILKFIGILGYSKAGPIFVETKKDYSMLSVTTKYVEKVKSALIFDKKGLECVGVSGTIKKAKRFTLQ